MSSIGLNSFFTIISHIFFITVSFNIIEIIDFNKILKKINPQKAQLLIIFISVSLGFIMSEFFISLIESFQNLKYLF